MAAYKNTHQHERVASIPRAGLISLATDKEFSKVDLRVILMLLSALDGFSASEPSTPGKRKEDPLNFRKIDVEAIAYELDLSEKKVKKSIHRLLDMGYIEKGNNEYVVNGYRFMF